jgi:hypothetical protein
MVVNYRTRGENYPVPVHVKVKQHSFSTETKNDPQQRVIGLALASILFQNNLSWFLQGFWAGAGVL